jgi:uncharacterized protein
MKKLVFSIALVTLSMLSFAQTEKDKPLVRKIEVMGSAELEITPDIIYFGISLKEYYDGKNKKGIDELEKSLQKAVADAGIPKENLTINNIYGYNYYWEKKRNPNFEARKQYRIKLNDLTKINIILDKLDAKGVEYVNIESYDHSKIVEYRKDLKIKALQAAKDKATYLLNSVEEKCGSPIEIQEIDGGNYYPQPYYRGANMMEAKMDASAGESDVNFKTIKLNYQIRAVFEITK